MKSFRKYLAMLATTLLVVPATTTAQLHVQVDTTECQHVTGFGAAALYGAMQAIQDTSIIAYLYGDDSPVGLNIMRVEISPSTTPDVAGTDYDWHGYLPAVKAAKQRGAIVFGTPWSPPPAYKTNNSASGGEGEANGNVKGKLKDGYGARFFTWLNSYLSYMKRQGAPIDIVSIQNEPDWWVDYSGCLYTPEEMHDLVANHGSVLKKEQYNVRLMGGESYYFNPEYATALLEDSLSEQYIDIIGGHIYGSKPLGNMAKTARIAAAHGKETWMTEHGYDVTEGDFLPTWHEQLGFAQELNEAMLAGGNAYVYWYMLGRGNLLGDGENADSVPENAFGNPLPRSLIMAHFAKNLKGSTRLRTTPDVPADGNPTEFSAYIKGDSLIVIAIDTLPKAYGITLSLPYAVKSGQRIVSTEGNLYQSEEIEVDSPTFDLSLNLSERSLTTFIFEIDREATVTMGGPRGIDESEEASTAAYTTAEELSNNYFVMVNTQGSSDYSLYFTDSGSSQDAKYMLTSTLTEQGTDYYYLFRATETIVDGETHYTLSAYNTDYDLYSTWLGSKLNMASGSVNFTGSCEATQFGTDIQNGGLWDIDYVDGKGFTFRCVAVKNNYHYYLGTRTLNQSLRPVYWNCYPARRFAQEEADAISVPTLASDADDGLFYTLDGIAHQQPLKGINIHNGRKILVK